MGLSSLALHSHKWLREVLEIERAHLIAHYGQIITTTSGMQLIIGLTFSKEDYRLSLLIKYMLYIRSCRLVTVFIRVAIFELYLSPFSKVFLSLASASLLCVLTQSFLMFCFLPLPPGPRRTSAACAPRRRASGTRAAPSTGSFQDS